MKENGRKANKRLKLPMSGESGINPEKYSG